MIEREKPNRCKRCEGQVFEDDDGFYCIQCGNRTWHKVTTATRANPMHAEACKGAAAGCTSSVHVNEPGSPSVGGRWRQVASLIAQGYSDDGISRELLVSQSYARRIRVKIGVA